jgi:hypothetical protein
MNDTFTLLYEQRILSSLQRSGLVNVVASLEENATTAQLLLKELLKLLCAPSPSNSAIHLPQLGTAMTSSVAVRPSKAPLGGDTGVALGVRCQPSNMLHATDWYLHLPLNLLPTDLAQYSRKRANSAQLGGLHAADPHVRKRTCYKEQLRLELKHGSQKGDDGERLREAIEWNVNYSGTDRVRVNGGPKVQKMWKQNLRQHLTDLATFGL